VAYGLASAAGEGQRTSGGTQGDGRPGDGDDVIDAEFKQT
jgi:hypothetical protein